MKWKKTLCGNFCMCSPSILLWLRKFVVVFCLNAVVVVVVVRNIFRLGCLSLAWQRENCQNGSNKDDDENSSSSNAVSSSYVCGTHISANLSRCVEFWRSLHSILSMWFLPKRNELSPYWNTNRRMVTMMMFLMIMFMIIVIMVNAQRCEGQWQFHTIMIHVEQFWCVCARCVLFLASFHPSMVCSCCMPTNQIVWQTTRIHRLTCGYAERFAVGVVRVPEHNFGLHWITRQRPQQQQTTMAREKNCDR